MNKYDGFWIHSLALVSIPVLLTVFLCQCSPNSIENGNLVSTSTNLSATAVNQERREDLKMKDTLKDRYESMLQMLDRESANLRIPSLRTTEPDSHSEIRIWVGFGLAYVRCVLLKQVGATQEAIYVGPKVIGGRAARDSKGKVALPKRELGAPRSGWIDLREFLKEQGVDSPIRLSMDDQSIVVPDGETIAIEAKSKDKYTMVFFSVYSKSQDAQKALQVCRRVEHEFGITMACDQAGDQGRL